MLVEFVDIEIECVLVVIFVDVFEVGEVGCYDDFFNFGGDSIFVI